MKPNASFHTVAYYPNILPFDPADPSALEEFMETAAFAGVTHVQINHLPDRMHPELCRMPGNFYLSFANFGPSLDLFVQSELNKGLYPELLLERNRRTLLRFAAGARRHGLKPLLYLCEPKFVPERFFDKYPRLRGPRVDNPGFSSIPLYALCSDKPEVLNHYRDMMARMMDLVPDLAMVSLFTSDSASGFDYNPDLYAGPNGPRWNRAIPLEKRVVGFLNVLLEEGRRRVPEFTINLTSGFEPEDRERILALAPEGVVGSVYGLHDWAGGLEEMWAYNQFPGKPQAIDRQRAFEERRDDMSRRFRIAARGGRTPLVHAELPTYDYPRPLRYTPHPYETVKLVRTIRGLGASALVLWGRLSPKRLVPWDVNLAAMKAAMAQPELDADRIIETIATEWVGREWASLLRDAWRLCDEAITCRPNWRFGFTSQQEALPGPLVPNIEALSITERAYYRTLLHEDLERSQGGIGSFIFREADERVRDYVLNELYEKRTFPAFRQALALLDCAIPEAESRAAEVLRDQRNHMEVACLWLQSGRNWYEAGRYLAPGADPGEGRAMPQIVDDEIEVTRRLIDLLETRQEQLLVSYDLDSVMGCPGPDFIKRLKRRIEVMQAHRDDPVVVAPLFR